MFTGQVPNEQWLYLDYGSTYQRVFCRCPSVSILGCRWICMRVWAGCILHICFCYTSGPRKMLCPNFCKYWMDFSHCKDIFLDFCICVLILALLLAMILYFFDSFQVECLVTCTDVDGKQAVTELRFTTFWWCLSFASNMFSASCNSYSVDMI